MDLLGCVVFLGQPSHYTTQSNHEHVVQIHVHHFTHPGLSHGHELHLFRNGRLIDKAGTVALRKDIRQKWEARCHTFGEIATACGVRCPRFLRFRSLLATAQAGVSGLRYCSLQRTPFNTYSVTSTTTTSPKNMPKRNY